MLEVHMFALYESHDDAITSYVEDTLCWFHTVNEIFLLVWASTQAKAKANTLRTELVKKWNIDKETCVVT